MNSTTTKKYTCLQTGSENLGSESPRKESPRKESPIDKHFPTVLGGLIGDYDQTSDSDSEAFNQFFNGDNNLEKGENVYFKVLNALFTTRLQDEYLKSKEKYIVQSIIIYKNNTYEEYKTLDMKNIDDNNVIFIECKNDHLWVYVTDNNWNKIGNLIKGERRYENISFFGPVNTIRESWIRGCHNLKSVDFTGLNSLKSVGNSWIYKCKNLKSIDFTG